MKIYFSIILVLAVNIFAAEKTSYTGYKLYSITIPNSKIVEFIHVLEDNDPEFDIWDEAKIGEKLTAQVMLSPKAQSKYIDVLRAKNVTFDLISPNVQEMIDNQLRSMAKNPRNDNIINRFLRFNDIQNFVSDKADKNPDIASTYDIGSTYEGRRLRAIVLKTADRKRGIWLDCGIHAREWVTPATCVYIIETIIAEYRNGDKDTVDLLNKYEIHILPVYNPDGYEYSHTTTRLWRKNRTPNDGSTCIGTDLNRNCDFRWREIGASALPCSDTYAGSKGNSELETQAVTDALKKKEGEWDAYISIHSYGDWWLTPWGHSATDIPLNNADLQATGKIGVDAIFAVHQEKFTHGSSSALLYATSGSSADWAYGAINVPYSYTLELRPGAGTPDYSFGFTLPEDRLPLVTRETWAGVKAALVHISSKMP